MDLSRVTSLNNDIRRVPYNTTGSKCLSLICLFSIALLTRMSVFHNSYQ